MHTRSHRTLRIPDDPVVLRSSILRIVRILRAEESFYVRRAFGVCSTHAHILKEIITAGNPIEHNQLQRQVYGAQVTTRKLSVQLTFLRVNLQKQGININTSRRDWKSTYSVDEKGQARYHMALGQFRRASRTVCAILGMPSLEIRPSDLPESSQKLSPLLQNLMDFIRVDPTKPPMAELIGPPSEKILLGVYAAALRDGLDFIMTHRLELALYPPFVQPPANIANVTKVCLCHLHGYFNYTPRPQDRTYGILEIPEPIRALQGSTNSTPHQTQDHRAAHPV